MRFSNSLVLATASTLFANSVNAAALMKNSAAQNIFVKEKEQDLINDFAALEEHLSYVPEGMYDVGFLGGFRLLTSRVSHDLTTRSS